MYEINLKSRSERQLIIEAGVDASEETETLFEFRNGTSLPVIKLSIDVPVYRVENCRTFTDQQERIAKRGLEASHFLKGQELSTVQSEQHEILRELAKKGTSSVSPIIDVLRKDGQRETILISRSGVVVNGNRRLSAMRELYAEEASVSSRFAYVKCQVLPEDVTRDEIDDVEAFLQARPRTKLEYDWIGDAQLVRRQLNKKGRKIKHVAEQLRRKESDIKKIVQSLEEADLYLKEWANKPGQYALVSDDAQQFFGDISKQLSGKDMLLQNASRAIAWSLFDNRDKLPGRIYSFNATFGKLAEDVLNALSQELEIPLTGSGEVSSDDDFAIDISGEEKNKADYSGVIKVLRNPHNKDETVEILIDVCQSALEKEKGQVSENAALRAISQAHSKLAGVDLLVASASTYPGIEKQLKAIRDIVGKLSGQLDDLKSSNLDQDEARL